MRAVDFSRAAFTSCIAHSGSFEACAQSLNVSPERDLLRSIGV
jgi:hypothetical protein